MRQPFAIDDVQCVAIQSLDWLRINAELDGRGWALTGPVLGPAACADLARAYDEDALYRSRVVMARHGSGRGE